jgi:hypothetical protein
MVLAEGRATQVLGLRLEFRFIGLGPDAAELGEVGLWGPIIARIVYSRVGSVGVV